VPGSIRSPSAAPTCATGSRSSSLDHPQSRAFKRERLAAGGLADPPNLHFGTVDFERESVADALERLPFRPNPPTVFAWLEVTMHLTLIFVELPRGATRRAAFRKGS
jgi:hypothetical protein